MYSEMVSPSIKDWQGSEIIVVCTKYGHLVVFTAVAPINRPPELPGRFRNSSLDQEEGGEVAPW